MTLADWVLLANLAAVVVAAVAILVSIRGLRDQLEMSTFLEYTKRYSEIMSRLPFDARRPGSGFTLSELTEDQYTSFMSTYREYFNMCWEEMWLFQKHRIDSSTWRIWVDSMTQTMDFPCAEDAWGQLQSEYAPYGAFTQFFDAVRSGEYELKGRS